jgi:chromosome condensin MukBEF MukE localization factor
VNDWDALAENTHLDLITIDGVVFRRGAHVRLRPKGRADAFDLLLDGHAATIESIEQDYENRIYLAVTVDADPGRDFGMQRRPAHRFFYGPEEVELIDAPEDQPA